MNAISAPAAAAATADRRRWIALIVVCLGQLMIVLDTTIVNVALPSIQHDLHFNQADLTWVINAYLISFGSFLLLAGRLGDLIGRKRIFLGGLVLFTAASAVCGFADSQAMLIAARFAQGVGGAFAASVILAIIVTDFPESGERARAMGIFTFVAVAGGSIGLLTGGIVSQSLNWHWIFFINLPIGLLAFVAGRRLIADNPGLGIADGVDVFGSLLVTVAMMSLVYAIIASSSDGWGSTTTLGFGLASLAMLGGFFAYESRISNPIFPLRILRLRGLIGSSVVRGCLVTGMFTTFFLGALYLERVRGFDSLQTGLAFLPMTLIVAALSLGPTAKLMARFGARRLLSVGMLFPIAGLALLVSAGPGAAYFPTIFVAFALVGLGMGTSFMPLLSIAMSDVPTSDAGLASGIVNVSMQMAAALGLAVLDTLATDHTHSLLGSGASPSAALTGGFHLAFTLAAVIVAVGILIALTVLRGVSGTLPARAGAADEGPVPHAPAAEARQTGDYETPEGETVDDDEDIYVGDGRELAPQPA